MSNKKYFLPMQESQVRTFGGHSSILPDFLPHPCDFCHDEADFYCVWCHRYICFSCAITHFGDGHHKEAKQQRDGLLRALREQQDAQNAQMLETKQHILDAYRYGLTPQRHIMTVTPEDLETKL